MTRRRSAVIAVLVLLAAGVATACGSQAITLDRGDRSNASVGHGADLFKDRCGGCHTIAAVGTEGSANTIKNRERTDGPNFDQRKEAYDQVLYAIRNGGFSGAIMPQNIVVGKDASDVALFVSRYAGRQAKNPPSPNRKTQPVAGQRQERPGAGGGNTGD
jgi:mono/diheme cytochrome c family protein